MSASVNKPAGALARQLGEYLAKLNRGVGGDASGRWLEANTPRSRGYWADIMAGNIAMNTNDIEIIADMFGMGAFDFIRRARESNVTGIAYIGNVEPLPERLAASLDGNESGGIDGPHTE